MKKKSCTAEPEKLEKTLYEMNQNTTVIGWLFNFKTNRFSYMFFITKRPASLFFFSFNFFAAPCQTPLPLAECPAKNASFFYVLPYEEINLIASLNKYSDQKVIFLQR